MTAARLPAASLALPALAMINAVFFHLGPTIVFRRYSPGLVTALLLVAPASVIAYLAASRAGLLTPTIFALSSLLGAFAMAVPLVYSRLRRG